MTDPNPLKRSLSLPLLTFYGLGTILGAGIYVLVGKVAAHAGPYVPIAFLVAAVLALFTALSYAELAARYPKSGGAAVYVHAAFHRQRLSLFIGFLMILTGMVSAATLVNGFVGYLHVFMEVPAWLVIAVLVFGMGMLAAWGIAESVAAAALITIIELGGLIFILLITGNHLADLPARYAEFVPPADLHIWNGIILGAFLAFYAFIGFEDMVTVAEETKEPMRNVPLAILLALGIATLLYVLVALAAVLALPVDELARTEAPFALLYMQATGQPPTVITIISLFAVVNGALIQIIMASRILYGMSREGWLHESLGRVHPVRRTPLLATALVTLTTLVLALWLPLVTLAKATSFITLVAFSIINLALLRIKHRNPRPAGMRIYPAWIPWAGFLSSFAFVLYQLATMVVR
jgi:amino acid transporter